MDFLDAAPDVPPIPTRSAQRNQPQHHHQYHARRRSSFQDSNSNPHKRASLPPASPEVISNLITSLSAISQPANNHFEAPTSISSSSGFGLGLSAPTSPGSFGVDYGAFSQPSFSLSDLGRDPVSLDDLAASPPVIRTAKPPSGYSTLTAPKSPRSPRSPSRESSGGLRSFIRNSTSRPSSKGSQTSKNDDAQSIGNLSVERGPGHTPELKRQRSHDSWGKKTSRSHKGLMYMSSRERLRERDLERKRSSGGGPTSGGAGLASGGGANGSNHSAGRPDPFLAETAIHEEEPTMANESSGPMDGPRPIPARDSSLRKTGSNAKRSSARRSKRDSDLSDAIPEDDELGKPRDTARRKNRNSSSENRRTSETRRTSAKSSSYGNTLDYLSAGSATSKRPKEGNRTEDFGLGATEDDLDEDGAPFPAVAQGRRRDECKEDRANRRRSGRWSPGPETALNPKRSSSRLKRLSAPLNSPKPDHGGSRDPSQERERERPRNSVPSGYERPQSADSIDDAVESYLCSPRLSQKIKHPQTGRVISFSEVGDSEGSAVFCCVGMGLTRYITAFYDELALTLKLRLITPDRPGVGDSEAYSDGTATPLSWPGEFLLFSIIISSVRQQREKWYPVHERRKTNMLRYRRCICHLSGLEDYQVLHPGSLCRCHLRSGYSATNAAAHPRTHSPPGTMDTAIPDERLWHVAATTAYQCHPDITTDSASLANTHPQGGQQQLHDGNKQFHYQLAAQEPATL